MNQVKEKTLKDLSVADVVGALIADDEDLKEFENELLSTITAMKNGDYSKFRETKITVSPVTEIRHKMQLSQPKFADILGVSASAVKAWEQGTRKPSGTALKLINLLSKRPELVQELA